MNEFPLAPLDRFNRACTAVVNLVLLGLLLAAVVATSSDSTIAPAPLVILLAITLPTMAVTWAFSPVAVRIEPDALHVIRRHVSPRLYPWSGFTAVEERAFWQGWKTWGCEGFFGYFGGFHGRELGFFRCHATRRTGAVVLRGSPTVVITPADPAACAAAIRMMIGCANPKSEIRNPKSC